MTDQDHANIVREVGPRPDEYHLRELPGNDWVTCRGCPKFRVHDWHYYYCRHLGDQSQPDRWWEGWARVQGTAYKDPSLVPCHLPVHKEPTP